MGNKKISSQKIKLAFITFVSLILYYICILNIEQISDNNIGRVVFFLSWIGIIELVYIVKTWRNLTGRYISLYTLFILFFFLFNYGQAFAWAFNIHQKGEIGSERLYYYLAVPDDYVIAKTLLIVLISGIMIHFGAIFFKKEVSDNNKLNLAKLISNRSNQQNILYKFSLYLSPLIISSEYYRLFINFQNAKMYGYTDLYYNPDVGSASLIILILSRLFFPILMGLLLGSGYKSKIVKIVYLLFAIDIILSLFVGDRGGWIYALCILIICHHFFYSKIRIRQFILVTVLGIVILYVSEAIVSLRNHGISFEAIFQTIADSENNPFFYALFQMGGSMGVTTTLVMDGWDIFPYGNSFFYGLLTAPTNDVISWLNLDYESLGSWFSQGYLGISNGAGFSIVAEALLNYGPYLSPIFMYFFGVFIYFITDIENTNPNTNISKVIFCVITTSVFISISRNLFSYNMGEVLYTTVQFFILYTIFKVLFVKRTYKSSLKKCC